MAFPQLRNVGRYFVSLVCVIVGFTGREWTVFAGTTVPRPNILFVLCDDLRWDALSCAGNPHVKTPHIDRLAREGVRFRNAFCTTSLCSPSRASILSGLYAHAHGVTNNFTEYPADLASFPRLLQSAGYETAYVGKWHMGEDNDQKRPGFDYFVTHKGQGKYFDTEFNLNGEQRETLPGYYTHVVTDLAENWLKRPRGKPWLMMLGHKAPHSFYFPEKKYEHAFDHVEVRYPDTAFQLDHKPAWIKQRLNTWHGIYGPLFEWRKKFPDDSPAAVKDFAAMTRAYWGTILSVDDSVGRLLKLLDETKQLDNTIVVVMGDNGLLNGEHGMVDKRTMHEPSIRVPLVVRYPKLTSSTAARTGALSPLPRRGGEGQGEGDKRSADVQRRPLTAALSPHAAERERRDCCPPVVEQMVLTVDMAPSLLELCGVEAPKNIHGWSWKRLVTEGDPNWRRSFLYHYNYEKQFPYTPNLRGVRTDDWKYVRSPHGDGGPDRHMAELYHVACDPDERCNLINDPCCANKVRELQAELTRLMRDVGITDDTMPLDEGVKQVLPDQKIR